MRGKQSLGQYFTKNETLKDVVFNFIKNEPETILEPSDGIGRFKIGHRQLCNVKISKIQIEKK